MLLYDKISLTSAFKEKYKTIFYIKQFNFNKVRVKDWKAEYKLNVRVLYVKQLCD